MSHPVVHGLILVALLVSSASPAVSTERRGAVLGPLQLAPVQDSLPSLSGSVRTDGSDTFLLGAIVELRQNTQIRRSKVGQDGLYGFDGLGPGSAELVVFHLATHPLEMRVELPT